MQGEERSARAWFLLDRAEAVLCSTVVQLSARPETGVGECRLTSVKGGEDESDIVVIAIHRLRA
jgi:hypothetical protein